MPAGLGKMAPRYPFLLLALAASGPLAATARVQAQEFAVPQSARAAIVDQTNAYRATKGLPPLSENEEASREAQGYADYLAETAKQGHSADGRSPFQRLRASGAKFCKFRGENWHEFVDAAVACVARGGGGCRHALLEALSWA